MNEQPKSSLVTYASVWDAISSSPEEAEEMKQRSALMMAIAQKLQGGGLVRLPRAAVLLGESEHRVSELLHGKVGLFTLSQLSSMAALLGLEHASYSDRVKDA